MLPKLLLPTYYNIEAIINDEEVDVGRIFQFWGSIKMIEERCCLCELWCQLEKSQCFIDDKHLKGGVVHTYKRKFIIENQSKIDTCILKNSKKKTSKAKYNKEYFYGCRIC